ncbi:MAG: peroxiredoxin [Gammaproteobacteria bacterium RBG_16_57_12]|nr:MAG: peroxiredoxin [Gammaproteobacteria bacterium RBG_16_57_12]
MAKIAIGKPIPGFALLATGDKEISLAGLKGKIIVLYFYPRDDTLGCTLEGQQFRDLHAGFTELGAVILGISRDDMKSHENFKAQQCFPFELISDEDETLCRMFDVIKMKNMYGKQVLGIERSTFLVDKEGILRKEWRKVKVEGHAEDVLQSIKQL